MGLGGSREKAVGGRVEGRVLQARAVDLWDSKPRVGEVVKDLGHFAPLLGVCCEQLVEQLEEAGRKLSPHLRGLDGVAVLPLHELEVVWVVQCGLFPGEAAGQHAEQEHSY